MKCINFSCVDIYWVYLISFCVPLPAHPPHLAAMGTQWNIPMSVCIMAGRLASNSKHRSIHSYSMPSEEFPVYVWSMSMSVPTFESRFARNIIEIIWQEYRNSDERTQLCTDVVAYIAMIFWKFAEKCVFNRTIWHLYLRIAARTHMFGGDGAHELSSYECRNNHEMMRVLCLRIDWMRDGMYENGMRARRAQLTSGYFCATLDYDYIGMLHNWAIQPRSDNLIQLFYHFQCIARARAGSKDPKKYTILTICEPV